MVYDSVFIIGVFLLGGCVGSFMDVVRTRGSWISSLGGRSHCSGCSDALRWYELVPILSYVLLRGRCRRCGVRIPLQHLLSELAMGAVFAYTFAVLGFSLSGIAVIISSVFLIPIAMADIETMEVPEHLSRPFLYIALIFSVIVMIREVSVMPIVNTLILTTPFFLLWFFSGGRAMGLGDAKVALPLGLSLPSAIGAVSVFIFSFWIGAFGVVLYVIYKRMASGAFPVLSGMRMPLVPSIALAYLLVALFGISLTDVAIVLYGVEWGGI